MICFHFRLEILSNFQHFIFDPQVISKCVFEFSNICEYPKFPPAVDFELIPLQSENILVYDFSPFKLNETYVMPWSILENVSSLIILFRSPLCYRFFYLVVQPFIESDIEVPTIVLELSIYLLGLRLYPIGSDIPDSLGSQY